MQNPRADQGEVERYAQQPAFETNRKHDSEDQRAARVAKQTNQHDPLAAPGIAEPAPEGRDQKDDQGRNADNARDLKF